MRMLAFAGRNVKEILRDPLNVIFMVVFPLFLMGMLAIIQYNAPMASFAVGRLTPGIMLFGFSFVGMFAGTLLASDRDKSFLMRLFCSPLSATDFIVGYTLPTVVMAAVQSLICVAAGVAMGLPVGIDLLWGWLLMMPGALLFVALGMLAGVVLGSKQVGGIFSLIINVATFLSGMWFELSMIGKGFERVCRALPFAHAFDLGRFAFAGDYSAVWGDLVWVMGYTLVIFAAAVVVFRGKMRGN